MLSEKYLKEVLSFYKKESIIPGDPEEGVWEEAHIGLPKHLGGLETVLLLKQHHYVHDIYQSEDNETLCFYAANVKNFLYGEGFLCLNWFNLVDLYEKWAGHRGRTLSREGRGMFDKTNPGYEEWHKKGAKHAGEKSFKEKTGIHAPENLGLGGRVASQRKTGVHDPKNIGKVQEGGRKGGSRSAEKRKREKVGIFADGMKKKGAEASNKQKWISLVDGFISTASGVANHNRHLGSDPKARKRLP